VFDNRNGPQTDNVNLRGQISGDIISTVPEPSAIVLLGTVVLGLTRKLRRKIA